MCKKCVDAVKRHYPKLPKSQYGNLLMSATAFPFGSPAYIEKQLRQLRKHTDGTVDGAIAYAHRQLHKAWRRSKARREAGDEPPRR